MGIVLLLAVWLFWQLARVIECAERLSWAERSADVRLAMHCGRNPYNVAKPSLSRDVPLYRWALR
jgi:hypothetical protein